MTPCCRRLDFFVSPCNRAAVSGLGQEEPFRLRSTRLARRPSLSCAPLPAALETHHQRDRRLNPTGALTSSTRKSAKSTRDAEEFGMRPADRLVASGGGGNQFSAKFSWLKRPG
jgi:hypothetical protein